MKLIDEIARLKREKDAVILAHYYVRPEVQDLADHVGDSFMLAKLASQLDSETIVFCGVRFMGESAKLLCPERRVLLPVPEADCPMAHMVDKELVDDARLRHGNDLAVVCYVNSTIETKSWSDVCVTSSNALKVISALEQSHILFIPDRNLGSHLEGLLPGKRFIFGEGFCPVHDAISAQEITDLKKAHSQVEVYAHPECSKEVLALADCIGSTSLIIERAAASDAKECIIATAVGVDHQMELRESGKGKEYLFPATLPICKDMALVTVERVRDCLRDGSGEVVVDPEIAVRAQKSLVRMLELAR